MPDLSLLTPTSPLSAAAALLSLAAFVLLAYVWRDCARHLPRRTRTPDPGRLEPGRTGRSSWSVGVWRTLLLAAFGLGLWGIPVATEAGSIGSLVTTEAEGPGAPVATDPPGPGSPVAVPARATRTTLRLPFWLRTAHAERAADGRVLQGSLRDTLQLPWPFLLALLLYLPLRRESAARSFLLPIVLAALGTGILLGPAPRSASASSCGGTDGPLCYTYTKCKRILIIQKCTTEYAYYPDYV